MTFLRSLCWYEWLALVGGFVAGFLVAGAT